LLFLTAEVFGARFSSEGPRPRSSFQNRAIVLVLLGAIGAVAPLVWPSVWLAPVIWLSFNSIA